VAASVEGPVTGVSGVSFAKRDPARVWHLGRLPPGGVSGTLKRDGLLRGSTWQTYEPLKYSSRNIRNDKSLLRNRSPGSLHEGLDLLQGEATIFVGIHGFEDPLVSRLKLLQGDGPITVSVH
jgi:hypothetical protein